MWIACDGGGKDSEAVLRYDALEELVANCMVGGSHSVVRCDSLRF